MSSGVAVVLTCYNEGAYIEDAVRSVLRQTAAHDIEEIVIADDGSDAMTVEALARVERMDTRIRVLYGAGGMGLPAQRNLAISATQAPLLAILDGDDLWTSDKLERQVVAFADARIGLVYSGYAKFAADPATSNHTVAVRDITRSTDLTASYFLNDPPIIPSTTIFRREAFERCGRFDPGIRVFEDTDFYVRLSRICRFAFVDAVLLHKRNRATSLTGATKDLMAHHAFVAFKAAAEDANLLALVPTRLSERARKLGNHCFVLGRPAEGRGLLKLALRLNPFNVRAWMSLAATGLLRAPAAAFVNRMLRSRRVSHGIVES